MITGPVTRQVPHLILVETAVIKRLAFCSVVAVLTNAFPRDFVTSTSILTATVILCKIYIYCASSQTIKYLQNASSQTKKNIISHLKPSSFYITWNHKTFPLCLILKYTWNKYLHYASYETENIYNKALFLNIKYLHFN